MTALQHPLDRLRDLIEADLYAINLPDRISRGPDAPGLHRALDLIEQVQQEQRAISEQMRSDPPGTVY